MKSKPSISSSTRKQTGLLACSRLDKIAKDSRCQSKVHHQAIQSEDNLIKNSDSCVPTSYHGIGHSEVVGLADIVRDVRLLVTSYLPEKAFSPPLELKECLWQELLFNYPCCEYTASPDLIPDDTDDNSTVLCDEKNCNSECFHVTNGSTVEPVGLSAQEDLEEPVSSCMVGYEYMIPEMVPDATEGCMLLPLLEEIVEANKVVSSSVVGCEYMIPEMVPDATEGCMLLPLLEEIVEANKAVSSSVVGYEYMIPEMVPDATEGCMLLPLLEEIAEANKAVSSSVVGYEYMIPEMVPDATEGCMLLPLLEEIVEANKAKSIEEVLVNSDDACLFLAIQEAMSSHQMIDHSSYESLDYMKCFDPEPLMASFLDLPQVFPSYLPASLPMQIEKRNPNTLVLDLDETLIHSSRKYSPEADFSFPVCVNMKKCIVYVRRRPHLHTFLDRVAEMFEIIIFTASQSMYADQILNILDPDNKIISQRVYREACVVSDGRYIKDLTVLGRDLAKVVIIDNTPQVFQLQVNNGIPIQSWFDDPTDCALLCMLPFLETLASADDVRPIIANRFSTRN